MDNDNDFTFCQVASTNSEDDFKGKNLASDISGIKIDDGSNSNSSAGFTWKDQTKENPTSTKQATVGSLSFNVTDRSVSKQVSKESTPETAATSVKNGKEVKKAPSRTKVPFEKGYSQMDWLKLTRTHPDLAGLKGQSNRRLIGMSEVKQHRTEGSMWTVLKGRVYNLSPYMKFHPGGDEILMKAVGKDCTSLFNKYHAWVNADFLMEKCLVGILDQENP